MLLKAFIVGIWAVAASAAAAQPLKILTNATLMPFEFKEQKKGVPHLSGFDIDVGEEIGRLLNQDVVWVEAEFAELNAKLLAGEADLAISAIRLGREADPKLTYVPYAVMEQVYLAPKTRKIGALKDLKGLNVGVLTADRARTELDQVRVKFAFKRVRGFETERALLTALSEGIIDAGVMDESRAVGAVRDSKGAWAISGSGLHREPLGIAISPANKALQGKIKDAVSQMRKKFLPELYSDWFGRTFPADL